MWQIGDNLQTLRDILSAPISTEADVTRFMVEVRKVVEAMDNRYQVLEFFGDWLLHGKLDRKGAKTIIKELDDFVKTVRANSGKETKAQVDKIEPLISLRLLQKDVAIFLAERGLDGTLVSTESKWQPFFSTYVELISKTPLVADAAKNNLTEIDNIKVQKSLITFEPPADLGQRFHFRIVWTLRKGTQDSFQLSSEVWLPKDPQSVTITALEEKTDTTTGAVTVLNYESKEFFKP